MFDPAEASSKMAPGDKVSMSFHKAKAEPGGAGGSFISNAANAGLVPGGAPAPMPQHMPQMLAVSHPAVPAVDHRALLMARLRHKMLGGR
jgi:hypothetical protein